MIPLRFSLYERVEMLFIFLVLFLVMSAFRGEDVSFSQANNIVHEPIHPHESIIHTEELSEHYSSFLRFLHSSKSLQFLFVCLDNLFLSTELSDVTLIVEGKSLPGHKVILAARSKYFR